MNRLLVIILLLVCYYTKATANDKDSLYQAAVTYAAHNNIAALRPLYKELGKELPHHIQLFCEMAIAKSEGRFEDMVDRIDSLRLWYPKQIKTKTQLSLAELKAEGLRQLGEYAELKDFCKTEIRILKRKGLRDTHLKELYSYQKKAVRLLGENERSQLLQLADRNLYFALDSLYNIYGPHADEFTRLRCEFALSQAFHQNDTLLKRSEDLVKCYIDSLDTETLSQCLRRHANVLMQAGKWAELKEWTILAKSISRSHYAPTLLYEKVSEAFGSHPPFEIVKPTEDTYLPSSYEWPFIIPVKVNDREDFRFTISTEQPHTLITQQMAISQNVEFLPDTVLLTSSHGVLEAHPAWIKQLAIGRVLLKNVYAYVLLPNNEIPEPFSCTLGWNELMALGSLTFLQEKLCIPGTLSEKDSFQDKEKNLFLTQQDGLCLQAYDTLGNPQPMSFDPSYPNNIVSKKCMPREWYGDNPLIKTKQQVYSINTPIFVEPKSRYYNGILGMPFFRHYQSITFNFRAMRFFATGECVYQPVRGIFGYETDKHYLFRSKEVLECGNLMDEQEQVFLNLMMALGKVDKENAVAFNKELRTNESDFYSPYTEAECLFNSGKYKAAVSLLKDVLTGKYAFISLTKEEEEELQDLLSRYLPYENEAGLNISEGQTTIVFSAATPKEIRINGKKIDAIADVFSPYTLISASTAKKRKVKAIHQTASGTYGIIPEINMDGLLLKNVPCSIIETSKRTKTSLPDKGKGLVIGFNALQHFRQISWKADTIEFATFAKKSTGEARLYYTDNWYIETEAKGSYPTFTLSLQGNNFGNEGDIKIGDQMIPKSDFSSTEDTMELDVAGTISIEYLLKKFGRVTIDLEKMFLFLR